MQICAEVNERSTHSQSAEGNDSWHAGQMALADSIKEGLMERMPNKAELARKTGLGHSQVSRLYSGTNVGYQDVARMLEAVGAKIVWPDEERNRAREVCWVDAKIIGAEYNAPPPVAERYIAVPLAEGHVAAGPGMVPQDGVKSWVLVFKDHPSVRFRSNLVAVEIGKGQESMEPLLHPLDLVLVDKDDTRPEPDGQIFLVREPDDSVTVKRVFVQRRDGEVLLNLVSDNPNKRLYPPGLYSLEKDYGGDLKKAIIGKCIWAWSDLTRK